MRHEAAGYDVTSNQKLKNSLSHVERVYCILHSWLLYHSVVYQIIAVLILAMGYHKCILQTAVLSVYVNY